MEKNCSLWHFLFSVWSYHSAASEWEQEITGPKNKKNKIKIKSFIQSSVSPYALCIAVHVYGELGLTVQVP